MRRVRFAGKTRVPAVLMLVAGVSLLSTAYAGASESSSASGADHLHATHRARAAQAPASLGDLLTYDYDNARSGRDLVDPPIKNMSSKPAWDDNSFPGGVYAQPLVYDGHVYVATENDSVYALAAKTGQVLWRPHVGTAVSTSVIDAAPTLGGGCGDIDPLGITGRPSSTLRPTRSSPPRRPSWPVTTGRTSGTGSSRSR